MEECLRVVSVTERLDASVDAQPSIRSTLSGMCVYENENDSLPNGNARESESERVKEAEGGGDCGWLVREDVPLRKMLQLANVSANVNVYLGCVN